MKRLIPFLLYGLAARVGTTPPPAAMTPQGRHVVKRLDSQIKYVVVIVQENRTVDNLFQFFPGARTQSYGYDMHGDKINLAPVSLSDDHDVKHTHTDWLAAYDNGKLDGWDNEGCTESCPAHYPYAYVPESEVDQYYDIGKLYTFADEMYASNEGPSFPAHQYLMSGTSALVDNQPWPKYAENPTYSNGQEAGGCDSPYGTTGLLIEQNGNEDNPTYPCFHRTSILSEAINADPPVSWRWYGYTTSYGFWNAPDALRDIQRSQNYSIEDVEPPTQVLTDISDGALAQITYVTPTKAASDHAGLTDGTGPAWVASVVNALGQSKYWPNVAILITWDDWGGWFDHEVPNVRNAYELSFRVPLLIVSPYAKSGYVSHTRREFGSILKFIEEKFGLPSMGTTDVTSDDLYDCFIFGASPRKFKPIPSMKGRPYFLHRHERPGPIDY
jgi:phospholipase C